MTLQQIENIFQELPGMYLILQPNAPFFTIVGFNKARAKATRSDGSEIGKNLFEVFTDNPDNPEATGVSNLLDSLTKVLQSRKPHTMALQRYDLINYDTNSFEERYWLPMNIPILDENGEVVFLVHSVEDVTEKVLLGEKEKKAKLELERMNYEQTQILESIADAFLSVDRNWIVKYWNNQAERVFGISKAEIVGRYLWDFIIEQKDNKLYQCFGEAMQKDKPAHFEKYYDPKQCWLQVNAYPTPNGLTAFLLDVTDRKTTEKALEDNERRFRALVENITDGITVMSEEGIIMDVSVSGKKILGYEVEELVGSRREDLLHPDDAGRVLGAFNNIIADPGGVIPIEFRFKMRDGSYKWLEATFRNLLHEESIKAIILNYRDITVRRFYEEQTLASEEKYRYLFDHNPATIIIWTLDDLKVREVNQTAVDQYQYSRNEFLQMTALDYRPVEEHERFLNAVLDLKHISGPKHGGIWVHKNRYDEIMYMNATFHRMTYGGMDAILVLAINVTEKTLLEKKLEFERNKKQKEISEAVLTAQENERAELGKELHDNINQILTTTRLYIEYALSKNENQDHLLRDGHGYLTKAIQEIRRLSRTLLPPSLDGVSLKQSFEELFKNINGLNGLDIHFDYLLHNEKGVDPKLCLSIFRIVQEQLNNILKHSQATVVNISLSMDNNSIDLKIEDNGIGFDTKKVHSGLGLKNITNRVYLFGGQVEIISDLKGGTLLFIKFPFSRKDA